jgi:hypothetical protein
MDVNYIWSIVIAALWAALGLGLIRINKTDLHERPMVGPGVTAPPTLARRGKIVQGLHCQWVEQQPSFQTWQYLADSKVKMEIAKQFLIWQIIFVVGAIALTAWNSSLSANKVAAIVFWVPLLAVAFVGLGADLITDKEGRTDNGPVAITVNRQAFIEKIDDQLKFLVLSQLPSQPWVLAVCIDWSEITQFSKTDYMATFGGGGKISVEGGWSAIIATPRTGPLLLISSTVEGDAAIYQRPQVLNELLSDSAREKCERESKALERPVWSNNASNAAIFPADNGVSRKGVPESL